MSIYYNRKKKQATKRPSRMKSSWPYLCFVFCSINFIVWRSLSARMVVG